MTNVTGSSPHPIETRYAGCLFRSRLEARWAVFFDAAGIEWQYEAQGYECQPRCGLSGSQPFWYLPDFWLPGLNLHAEVKGSLTEPETRRLLDAAAFLSAPRGGCGDGSDLVVLGPVPRGAFPQSQPDGGSYGSACPVRLHMHKGVLTAYAWPGPVPSGRCGWLASPLIVATDGDESIDTGNFGCRVLQEPVKDMTRLLISGFTIDERADYRFERGYEAARSARFEHGQSGAPR